jgi:hypothetical protein
MVSKSPLILDDFSAAFNKVDLSDPRYSRGALWYFTSKFFYIIPLSISHLIIGLIHITNAFLIIFLLRKLWGNQINIIILPFLLVLLLVNPIVADNIIWLLAAYPIFVLFFSLLGCIFLLNYIHDQNKISLGFFILFSSLAYFENEQGLIIFPLYIIVVLAKFSLKDIFIKWRYNLLMIIKIFCLWITPYIAYRFFLYAIYGATSATQPYALNFNLNIILTTYKNMIVGGLFNSVPIISLVVIIFINFIVYFFCRLTYGRTNETLPELRKKIFVFIMLPLLILLLLGPFALLGGWLEGRFYYIPSQLFILLLTLMFGITSTDVLKIMIERWKKVFLLYMCLLIVYISSTSIISFNKTTLKPIEGIQYYVNNLLEKQVVEYSTLPKNSNIVLIVSNPVYPIPKHLFAGGAVWTLRAPWVAVGMKKWGFVPENINTLHITENYQMKNGNINVINTSIILEDFDKGLVNEKLIHVYLYDGNSLEKLKGNQFILTDNNDQILRTVKLSE